MGVRRPRERSLLDRALAAIPLLGVALIVITFYAIEAWTRRTPWVFTDELEWTQLSRAIADTGHAARRGQPIYFKSLYAYLIAPLWWIHSTATAYAAIKYLNVAVMTTAAVPTYLLARMLVSRPASYVVALLAVAIPGMFYASSLVPEVLAYPWYALCSWLIVRALTTGRRRDALLAAGFSLGALLVRAPQLGTVSISFAMAAAGLWVTGPRGRALRARWSRADTVGAAVLLAGALILVNRIFLQHVEIWQVSTQYWKNRMVDLGLRAGLAFVVGIGILPVLGGLASLRLRERRGDPAYRAFAAYTAASIVSISLYTAVKAAYLSTVFATLTEERNMIYLAPLMLTGTALAFAARRVEWWIVAAGAAFVLFLIVAKPFDLGYPYFESPGFGILTMANRHFHWNVTDLRQALVVALAVAVVLLVARRVAGVAAIATLLVLAWMVTAEVTSTAGSTDAGNNFIRNLPKPLDWIDRATGRARVTYLGQQVKDANGIWLTEFWNRGVDHVYTLDGTGPGPGPTTSPNIDAIDGRLTSYTGDRYVLADNGVDLQARVVAEGKPTDLRLYELHGPWKLRSALQAVFPDGWAGPFAGWTFFPRRGPGFVRVTLSRTGYNGGAPPGRATILVGTVKLVDQQAAFDRVTKTLHVLVRNDRQVTRLVPVAETPVRVEMHLTPTFRTDGDQRDLGAQVSFEYVPRRTARSHGP